MSAESSENLDGVFAALAHPLRRSILERVNERQQTVVELAAPHAVSLNAVSKHIKKLEAAGLVTRDVDGSYHRISINRAAMNQAIRWMTHYVPFWHENLQRLKTSLEKDR